MKIVLLSDLQAHKWKNYTETDDKGVNLRILDVFNELDRIRKLSIKNGVEALFVLGDIFEARNELNISVLNNVYYALKGYHDSGIRVVLLVGNHDRTGVGKEHALEVFKPFCEIVDQPKTFPMQGGDVLAIPFYPNAKTTQKAIEKFTTKKTKLIVGHTAIQTLKMPNGELWGQGISLKDIPKHVKAVFGHFHRFSELIPGRVYYVGSMIQVDQSDASIDKFFAVYDSGKDIISFHQTKGPRFVALEFPNVESVLFDDYERTIRGNFVTVKSVPVGYNDFAELEKLIRDRGARHVDWALTVAVCPPPLSLIADAQGITHEEVIRHYVEESENVGLNKDDLVNMALDIAEQVGINIEDDYQLEIQ